MIVTILLLIVGLLLIIKGGDTFVDAASWMAEKTGIPKLIIGATVVSIATTMPEMLVSFIAAAGGKVDMAIGNAVGSVTVNIGLIMGIALICMPTAIRRKDYLIKSLLMLSAALILVLFGLSGTIGLIPNIMLIIIFIIAMFENVREAKEAMATADKNPVTGSIDLQRFAETATLSETPINIAKFILGAAAIVIGSRLLVDNGSILATTLGVPERIIAVSIVAIGTSLPELVTTITAIAKKQASLSAGNIIGANIIDLTLILPISSLLAKKALPVSTQFARVDLPACLLIGCLAMIPSLITKKFHRIQGIMMVICYVCYLAFTTLILK